MKHEIKYKTHKKTLLKYFLRFSLNIKHYVILYICICLWVILVEGMLIITVIVIRIGIDDPSSNPGQGCLHFNSW